MENSFARNYGTYLTKLRLLLDNTRVSNAENVKRSTFLAYLMRGGSRVNE